MKILISEGPRFCLCNKYTTGLIECQHNDFTFWRYETCGSNIYPAKEMWIVYLLYIMVSYSILEPMYPYLWWYKDFTHSWIIGWNYVFHIFIHDNLYSVHLSNIKAEQMMSHSNHNFTHQYARFGNFILCLSKYFRALFNFYKGWF